MIDFSKSPEMQKSSRDLKLPEYLFFHEVPVPIPRIYPTVTGLTNSSSSFQSPPEIFYPKVEEVEYYYQKFYGSQPGTKWISSPLHFNPWTQESWEQPSESDIPDTTHLYPTISIPPPTPVFSINEFQELRSHSSIESALSQLNDIAQDITHTDPTTLPMRMTRACLICANSYTNPTLVLGVGPVNDSITVAANHKYMGYRVFFVHNSTPEQFIKCLTVVLQRTTEYLTVFYTGHGSNLHVYNQNNELISVDQVMVFDKGRVADRELEDILKKYSNGCAKTLLLTDCCHSGTIWNIPSDPVKALEFPANIVSVSSTNDDQTAKQGKIANNSQGLFTFFFWKTFKERPDISMNEMKKVIDGHLMKYQQECELHATRPGILSGPFFQFSRG
ncbi:Clan CD, family C14, metacaspase-like cysteine peptidase [Histomonas meleagridis]|uniref:Clan CD, family C14, metacaspase-like cysteine peptidase n=1 Tax=Histomonas meleagridis TaxID=135588 RepID=UPI00355A2027|nr:Clan CD, family C14, metacaspase-like cysteine peptidase [Histomonas meleagridis]KAH0803921.1 Clan CD, family C14, metacaspase-like cysteine peptidase [Histomonas meleagridis]